jgi:hypothetical protein
MSNTARRLLINDLIWMKAPNVPRQRRGVWNADHEAVRLGEEVDALMKGSRPDRRCDRREEEEHICGDRWPPAQGGVDRLRQCDDANAPGTLILKEWGPLVRGQQLLEAGERGGGILAEYAFGNGEAMFGVCAPDVDHRRYRSREAVVRGGFGPKTPGSRGLRLSAFLRISAAPQQRQDDERQQ